MPQCKLLYDTLRQVEGKDLGGINGPIPRLTRAAGDRRRAGPRRRRLLWLLWAGAASTSPLRLLRRLA